MRKSEKYIVNMLAPRFTSWWLRSNQLPEHHFAYDAEELRKKYQSFENLWGLCWMCATAFIFGWLNTYLYDGHKLWKVGMYVGAPGFIWMVVLLVKRHLLFKNHALRILAMEWGGVVDDLRKIKTFRGMTEDGSVKTIAEKIDEQLVAWAFESLKMKAVKNENCALYVEYLQIIKRVLLHSKKCTLPTIYQNEVWARAKAERI
jgi:hypothetical protein